MTFKGYIKNGSLKINDLKGFNQKKSELEGEEVRIELEKWYKKRSGAQNRYYWGVVIDTLQEYSGEDPERIHARLKQKFLPKEQILDGEAPLSSKKLTTADFEDYMRKIRQWASRDYNVYIPEPNEAPGGYAYQVNNELPL